MNKGGHVKSIQTDVNHNPLISLNSFRGGL